MSNVLTLLEPGWRRGPGDPGRLSSARSFAPPVGSHIGQGEVAGYYIDLSLKTATPEWPPPSLASPEKRFYVAVAQWGLGCYERYLKGEGEAWLDAASAAADDLVEHQERGGRHDGGWVHRVPMPHSYDLRPPWLSAMAQGQGASLLLRVYREHGEERYAEAARRALLSCHLPTSSGGLRTALGEGFFLEEYPTDPPSLVLNGGIFALWGCRDVGVALGDAEALEAFHEGAETLAGNIRRWDTGRWSLYDLFPHRALNVASSAYHVLHQTQLRATQLVSPHPELQGAVDRFEAYYESRLRRAEALARKVFFRVLIPRNRLLAHRTPFVHKRAG